jgi:hypothetical protein
MTNFKKYPPIYTDACEKLAKASFAAAFKQSNKFVEKLND